MEIRFPVWVAALLTLVIGACVFLVGAIPAEGDLGDVTFVQWLLLVIFLGSLFGITVTPVQDRSVVARVRDGHVRAGEAARYATDTPVTKELTLAQLVDPHATTAQPDPPDRL